MAHDTGTEHEDELSRRRNAPTPAGEGVLEQSAPAAEEPLYPGSLLDNRSSRASYNLPARNTVMRSMQQTYGNHVLQRRLAGGDQAGRRSYGEQAVQRWEVSRSSRSSGDPGAAALTSEGSVADAGAPQTRVQRKTIGTTGPSEQGAQVAVQRATAIKSGDDVVGEFDGLGGLESSYQSTWEGEKKSVGISYRMVNARKKPSNDPVPGAVAHAHIKGNGQEIAGVSVKSSPGGAGAQWVSPAALDGATKAVIVEEMQRQTPNPMEVTNIRKVSMQTDTWNDPPHKPVEKTKIIETVYIAEPGGFVQEKRLTADLIYDIRTGKYLTNDIFASKAEAQAAADAMPMPTTAAPVPTAAPTGPEAEDEDETADVEETAPSGDDLAKAEAKRKKNAEKKRRLKEKARQAKQTAASPSAAQPQASAEKGPVQEEPEPPTGAANTSWLRSWINWATGW